MQTFYLVRHAHAVWKPDENRSLSSRGRQHAQNIAETLSRYPITAIYSSPARRAKQTVAPLANQLGQSMVVDHALRERALGHKLANDFHAAVRQTWDNPHFAHPGGESNLAAQRRGFKVIQRLQKQVLKGHIVIATHGNLLALILQCFDPSVGFDFWHTITMPDIYRLQIIEPFLAEIDRLWKN